MAGELEYLKERLRVFEQVEAALEAALRITRTSAKDFVPAPSLWRLTLECGHLRLDGPWESGEPQRFMIGDVTFCEVCPRRDSPSGRVMLVRQVVNVECVPGDQYREPEPKADAERREGLGLR